jgi:hypothetical protein
MTEYVPTDTDISEIGDYQDDYIGLLAKSGMLSTENEILKKQLKDEIIEHDNRIQHLIFENERSKSCLESANNLLTFFQSQDNSKYKKINEQLSTKNFDLEQTNHSLKRENFSLKRELDEIESELEKLKALKAPQNLDYSVYSTYQGSKSLETEGNLGAYNYINTETLKSNNLLPAEGRGSVLRDCAGYIRQEPNLHQKVAEDSYAIGNTRGILNENIKVIRNGSIHVNNNYNFINESEKYMVNEKLTENDFFVTNNENEMLKNKANAVNNNIKNSNDKDRNSNYNIYNNYIANNVNQDVNSKNNNNILDDSCDSSTEEIQHMSIDELKSYIKKVKKESKDFYKKALDMLTENEFEIMKLKSENEHINESTLNDFNQRNSISSLNYQNKYFNNPQKSTLSCPANESLDVQVLLEELETLKRESFEKQSELESEKMSLLQRLSQLEINHKLIVSDHENEIYKFKYEIENLEIEKNILEKDINKENHERSNMAENLEYYNEIIRNLQEQKDKSENNNRNLTENLMSEKKKIEKIILENMETMHKLETEIRDLKVGEVKAIKELSDDFKKEKLNFQRELIELRGNNSVLTRERELLKKELENAKVTHKNAKIQMRDITIENARLKEVKNDEVKLLTVKLEDNLEELNTKFHDEKLNLQEKIKELLNVIDGKGIDLYEREESLTLQNIEVNKQIGRSSIKDNEAFRGSGVSNNERKDSNNLISSFNLETLNKEIENLKSKNFKLQVEINTLNNKLKVKENKIQNTIRLKTEIDALKKEKSKYKADMLELKKLYEEQINELLENLNSANNQNSQNNANNNNNDNNIENIKNLENANNNINNNNMESIEELKVTLLRLNYEKHFLQDQVSILTKELENMEKLKNDYIKKLKEDLEQTEEIAARAKLSVAQISFDKETELVKYKKYCKKLKMKMQVTQSLLQAESLNIISPPEKIRINGNNSLQAQYSTNHTGKKSLGDFSLANDLNTSGNVSKVNAGDYMTNIVNDNSKKSFFDKLFSK